MRPRPALDAQPLLEGMNASTLKIPVLKQGRELGQMGDSAVTHSHFGLWRPRSEAILAVTLWLNLWT